MVVPEGLGVVEVVDNGSANFGSIAQGNEDGVPFLVGPVGVVSWTDKIHRRQGNFAFSDGSAQQITSQGAMRFVTKHAVGQRLLMA